VAEEYEEIDDDNWEHYSEDDYDSQDEPKQEKIAKSSDNVAKGHMMQKRSFNSAGGYKKQYYSSHG
jgi:hypothetical protein